MQYTLALLGLAASVMAKPMPAAVTSAISPSAAAPSGCNTSPPGSYFLSTVNVSQSSSMLAKRQGVDNGFSITINGGVMHDQSQYTGYIAANRQFQFDPPPGPQAGAIYTAGWSLCPNNTVALGGSTIFYSCVSGSFSNIYDQSQGMQCSQIFLSASSAGGSSASGSMSASQMGDGQPNGATSAMGSTIAQTSDHQPQGATSAGGSMVAQTSDHQPQAATSAPASAIQQTSDHQPQAATSAAASQNIGQTSDHQPQAATSAAASGNIAQTSDHQPQAATSAAASGNIAQTSDHQPQAPTAANATMATPAAYTGAAIANKPEVLALAAGAVALFL